MPTFLAIDYLQEATGRRGDEPEKSLLPEPDHLEAVDSSFRAVLTVNTYWSEESAEALHILTTESGYSEIEADFVVLTLGVQPILLEMIDDSAVEYFLKYCLDETVDDGNYLSDGVEDVLDQACEEVFCAADGMNCGIEVEDLTLWFSEHLLDLNLEFNGMCLEDVIVIDDLEKFRERIPGSYSLSRRLKPKAVQDPFLTRDGQLITEKLLKRWGSDYDFDFGDDLETIQEVKSEEILYDDLSFINDELYEELLVLDRLDVLEGASDVPSLHQMTHVLHLQCDNLNERESPDSLLSTDLARLVECSKNEIDALEVLSPLPTEHPTCDFIENNNKGCENARDIMANAVLESPIFSPFLLASHPQIPFSLGSLSPLPLSPEWSLRLFSPKSMSEREKKLIESEKDFDDVLGLMLAMPNLQLDFVLPPSHKVAIEALQLAEYEYTAESELLLPWDPLVDSVDAMKRGREMLVSDWHHLMPYTVDDPESETFVKEQPFYAYEGDDLPLTLSFHLNNTELTSAPGAKGVPTWTSNAEPRGYHKFLPSALPHSDCTSMNVQSSKHRSSESNRLQTESVGGLLDDFLILRGTQHASMTENIASPCSNINDETENPHRSQIIGTDHDSTAKSVNLWEMRDVKLTSVFKEILVMIEQRGEMIVANLHQLSVLSPSETFCMVTLERLRFVLKEKEKELDDTEESNATIVEAYKQTACLYTLIDVADLLINCSFRAATDRFTSIQQQQRDVVGNSLDGLAQSLLANQCALEEQKITHPKIAMLVDMATKIVKNRDKESMKALFVVSRSDDVLLDEISQSLNRVEGLRLKLLYPGNNSSSDLMSSLQDFDCVVTSVSCLPSDGILCDQFQLIVRYENDDSPVFDLVGQQVSSSCVNCRLLVLNVVGFSLQQGVTELDGRDGDWNRQQMTFIGSTKVVEDTDLLQLLEARYNIVVVVRNFNELEDSSGRQYFADVIVDERTGIVLVEQSDLSLPTFLKSLRQRTTFLSFKYETCWIIVRSKLDDAHRQSFGDCCSRNIARLLASSAHFSPEENGFEMRLAYAFGNDETARIVREIGELAYENTKVWQKSQWIQRSWLTEQMSLHEKFLISIPSINSLSAQVMLTAAPLRDLLSMSREELFSTCRWLPVRVLERFYETTHWGRRTLLSPSDSLVDTLPHLRLHVESTDRYDEGAESEAAMVELVNDMCTPPSVTGLCERTDSLVMSDDVGVDFDSDVSMIEESVESRNYRAQQSRCVGLKSLGRFHGGRTRRRHARDDFAAAAAAAAMGVGDSRREENERYCTMRQSNSRGSSVKSFCREASLPKRVCPSGMDCSVSQSRDEAHYTGCLERCGESVSRYADVVTRGDRRVPSSDLCGELDSYSNSPDWSVYSPTLVSSGSSHSGKRLVYRRVPGSVDGQTKLAFS